MRTEPHRSAVVGLTVGAGALLCYAAATTARWVALRHGVRSVGAAAAAVPWPPEEIDAALCRYAVEATRSSRAAIHRAAAEAPAVAHDTGVGGPLGGHQLTVDWGVHARLHVSRPATHGRYGSQDRTVLAALIALAEASRTAALREAAIRQHAVTDALTGLATFPRFLTDLHELVSGLPAESGWAVAFLDLDHFKAINTRLGHLDADEVLRETGRRILDVDEPDLISGRFGGDEFLGSADLWANSWVRRRGWRIRCR
ncbi:MAG: GGDEF domain-containing protein [Actinobacteria bacterium]|nr:GGDEF domain-containing protein [Actinomycetota bacterium]